ncbi:response regulator transcription factor [Cyanobium sp. Morenito 9A2]|uniref:response regulator transcription factor n=1 Tax=Cyanobium sp. Morenito 9A2 TaxID=2823718 RepID=UPI0020CF6B0E|nr:response regulator transcription factor [Cyanobium sp. Morenito 9A2]MCP9850889.1 response regulator transcription factor [Cyanobium sp. Morenito 9A2]
MARCLVVEDDELFRLGLEITLAGFERIEGVLTASDGEQALELLRRQAVEVVLLDLGLPGLGGLETCRRIASDYPELPVLVITSQEDPAACRRLLLAGARGYVRKGVSAHDLQLAIETLLRGASWWDAQATAALRDLGQPPETADQHQATEPRGPQPSNSPGLVRLTPREREVLEAMAQGWSNQQIAATLGISLGTVRVHGHGIMQKLGVTNRTQAVLRLLEGR